MQLRAIENLVILEDSEYLELRQLLKYIRARHKELDDLTTRQIIVMNEFINLDIRLVD